MVIYRSFFLCLSFAILFLSGCINPYSFYNYPVTPVDQRVPEALQLQPIWPTDKVTPISTIIVRSVESGSPADVLGIVAGDEILSVGDKSFGTVERFIAYLERTRWLDENYKVLHTHGTKKVEKLIRIKPQKDFPFHGMRFKYLGNNGTPVYPVFLERAWIWQERENSGVGFNLILDQSLLKLSVEVRNFTDNPILFDKSNAIILDANKTLLRILEKREALTVQYQDALSRSPMAALQTLPTMTAASTATEKNTISIPPGAKIYDEAFVKYESFVRFPISVKLSLVGEDYEFSFNR